MNRGRLITNGTGTFTSRPFRRHPGARNYICLSRVTDRSTRRGPEGDPRRGSRYSAATGMDGEPHTPMLFALTAEDLAATCQSDSGGEDPTVLVNVGEDWT